MGFARNPANSPETPPYVRAQPPENRKTSDCYIDHFIRNERLEEDLIGALDSCGVRLSENQRDRIRSSGRTNASSRKQNASYYYDDDTIALVYERERFIVDKFGYVPPTA